MGLPEPLRTDVELAHPEDLDDAISLALAYERRAYPTQSSIATTPRSSRSFTRPSLLIPATKQQLGGPTVLGVTIAAATTQAGRTFRRPSPTEIAECRKQGLCFNCDEQFVRGHRCASLFSIEVDTSFNDDFETLPKEENCVKVSIQAMTDLWSIQVTDTLQLEVLIGNSLFTALLDTGSTRNFIDESALARAGLTPCPCPCLRVMVANGNQVASGGVCRGLPLHIGEQQLTTDCFAIPLGSFDIVLGVSWLRNLGRILWDFDNMTVSFHWEGQPVTWTYRVLSRSAVDRALVAPEPEDLMTELLAEFDNIFTKPSSLPPVHAHDHRIQLQTDGSPVAVRPYRYPQLQKDEIERQC
uniref:Peptidase A2 domain-containing protein n=1 Tax=Aegilops tauschii subsp. strangulata TaxID=200361 RepID=A0A453GDA1_AEGTS